MTPWLAVGSVLAPLATLAPTLVTPPIPAMSEIARIAETKPTPPCLADAVAERDRDLHRHYLYTTNGRQGIRGFRRNGSNESILMSTSGDSKRLVILWHGFMASPPEMKPLGEYLHEALGATVYIPLIPGFGSGHEMADHFGLESWRESVRDDIELAAGCHSEIALVGYSIGGGLVTDLLLDRSKPAPPQIRAAVLLSPYIETAGWMAPALRARPRAGALHFLRSVIRLRSLRLETLYRWSRRRYRDLEVLLAHPDTYDQSFSLKAGLNMLRLTRKLRGTAGDEVSDVSTLLALSEADRTVNWAFTEAFVGRHFSSVEGMVRYPDSDGIAHQIVVPEVNPRHVELYAAVASFLGSRFENGLETTE